MHIFYRYTVQYTDMKSIQKREREREKEKER